MKFVLYILAFFLTQLLNAQDYFALVVKNHDTTYNYPENAEITIIDSVGNKTKIEKDDAVTLEGEYTLSIVVPWKKEPEILKSDGGVLEIYMLPEERRNWTPEVDHRSETTWYDTNTNTPSLERKEILFSKKNPDRYNLLAVFNNGLVFKYEDGAVRAWLDSEEIEVTNHYLVETPEGLLKISFDPKDGEFWYVFES